MTDTIYPAKTCQIERLVTHPKLVAAALEGRKTQQRRNGVYAYPGEIFSLEGIEFEVTSLERQALGEMTDQDAQAEGYPTMYIYKDLILKMHANMEWDEAALVWVHNFKRLRPE
jgi:hypothetical protein